MEVVAKAPTHEDTGRLSRRLAEDIPAGHVDARLDIRMPLERRVHPAIELANLEGVRAKQVRPKLGEPGTDPVGVGREVEGPERTNFTVPDEPRIRLDLHHGAVEDGN